MATLIETLVTDDLDGSTDASTVLFGLDGKTYEIDLSDKNAQKLRAMLAPYTDAARVVRLTPGQARQGKASTVAADKARNTAIRAWAAENGIDVAPRGRIGQNVIDAYERRTVTAGERLPQRTPKKTAKPPAEPDPSLGIREWARAKGFAINERGRVPAEIQAAYDARERSVEYLTGSRKELSDAAAQIELYAIELGLDAGTLKPGRIPAALHQAWSERNAERFAELLPAPTTGKRQAKTVPAAEFVAA